MSHSLLRAPASSPTLKARAAAQPGTDGHRCHGGSGVSAYLACVFEGWWAGGGLGVGWGWAGGGLRVGWGWAGGGLGVGWGWAGGGLGVGGGGLGVGWGWGLKSLWVCVSSKHFIIQTSHNAPRFSKHTNI